MQASLKKTAVITGGNSGIGFALAQKLLEEGYEVISTSRSGKTDGFSHPHLSVIQLEITDPASIKAATKTIASLCDRISLLVNNAGIAPDALDTIPEMDNFMQTINVNLTGLVFFAESLLPLMSEGGQIINISSAMGLLSEAQPNGPAYRISKAGLNMYSKILSQRLTERNIRVTAVHPGWVRTKLGGDQAPMDAATSAAGLYETIRVTAQSGEFSNVQTGERFSL